MSEKPRRIEITDPVTIEVDGQEVTAQNGELLIDACERNGAYIPRFCYHPRMKPVGMCRMCLVEVDTGRGPALQPSCMIPVAPNMAVDTKSEMVQKAQDGVLEFLLINHPLDCPVCDKGGECPLQDQTMAYGPGESRWVEEKRHYEKPIPLSDLVFMDRERCILCDRCTRFADDVAGDPLIHFIDRGAATQVNTFPNHPFASYFSGNTVQICPVGALTAKPYRFKARPWDLESAESTCTVCSVGCRISIDTSRNEVLRYAGVDADPVNWSWLCDKGRFSFESIHAEERLTEPLLRQGEGFAAVRWADALRTASDVIRKALANGPGGVAVIGGARLTNEDAYGWAKFAKSVIGTDHVDAQLDDGLPAELALGLPSASINDVCTPGGTILWLGGDPKEELPVLFLRIRHAVVEQGAKLVVVGDAGSLAELATATVAHRPGETAEVLTALLGDGPTEVAGASAEAVEAARAVIGSGEGLNVVIGRPNVAVGAATVSDAVAVVRDRLPEAGFLVALRRGNVRGALDLGLAPGMLPGRVTLDAGREWYTAAWGQVPAAAGLDTAGILREAAAGRIDVLILLGADPLSDAPDAGLAERALTGARYVIALDTLPNASTRRADLVLPVAGFAEVSGTTTNLEGRVSTVRQKVTAVGTSRSDWMIAAELAARMGHDLGFATLEELQAEMFATVPLYAGFTTGTVTEEEQADGVLVPLPARTVAVPLEEGMVAEALEADPTDADREADAEAPVIDDTPALPEMVAFSAPEPTSVPGNNSYSLRLLLARRLYDGGTIVANSRSLAGLAAPTHARLSPADFTSLGISDGGRVTLTSPNGSITVPAHRDASVAKGIAKLAWGVGDADPRTLLSADDVVTAVRVEVAG